MSIVNLFDTNSDYGHSMLGNYLRKDHSFETKVWIYRGLAVSDYYKDIFKAQTLLIINEHKDYYDAMLSFHFQGERITLKHRTRSKSLREFFGATKDSRGFDVEWRLKISGDEITGSYKMNYDQGSVNLSLISLKKHAAEGNQSAYAATVQAAAV